MKKILFLNTVAKGGGASSVAESLFEECNNSLEYRAYFAYGRGGRIDNSKYFYFGNRLEVFVHLFLVRFFGIEGYGTYFATRRLIKYIEKGNFDIIHIHNLHGYYLNFFYLLNFLKKQKTKIIWTLHDEWLFTWLPAYSAGCDHCSTLKGDCSNIYSYPKNYLPIFANFMLRKKTKFFSSATFVTLVSPAEWLLERKESSPFKLLESRLIPNGIDTSIYYKRANKDSLLKKYGIPLNKKIIVFSAHNLLLPTKGINYILDVADKLKEKEDYYFIGFGNGKLKTAENVKLLGYLTQEESAEVLSLGDIYIFTSLIEVHPLVILQALSVGLPIVAFNIVPLQKIITSDVGILVPYGSIQAAANSINYLLSNSSEINYLSDNAMRLSARFKQDAFYQKYSNLYQSL